MACITTPTLAYHDLPYPWLSHHLFVICKSAPSQDRGLTHHLGDLVELLCRTPQRLSPGSHVEEQVLHQNLGADVAGTGPGILPQTAIRIPGPAQRVPLRQQSVYRALCREYHSVIRVPGPAHRVPLRQPSVYRALYREYHSAIRVPGPVQRVPLCQPSVYQALCREYHSDSHPCTGALRREYHAVILIPDPAQRLPRSHPYTGP